MPSPSLTLAVLLATLYAALMHTSQGGDGHALILDILTAYLGFGLGQAAGQIVGITALAVGPALVLVGTLGAVIALAAYHILRRQQVVRNRQE